MRHQFTWIARVAAAAVSLGVAQAAWSGVIVTASGGGALDAVFPVQTGSLQWNIYGSGVNTGSLTGWGPTVSGGLDTPKVDYVTDPNAPAAWTKTLDAPASQPAGQMVLIEALTVLGDTAGAESPWLDWHMQITTPGWSFVDGTGVVQADNSVNITGAGSGASGSGDVYNFIFDIPQTNPPNPDYTIGAGATTTNIRFYVALQYTGTQYSTQDIVVLQSPSFTGTPSGDGGSTPAPAPATPALILIGLLGMAGRWRFARR